MGNTWSSLYWVRSLTRVASHGSDPCPRVDWINYLYSETATRHIGIASTLKSCGSKLLTTYGLHIIFIKQYRKWKSPNMFRNLPGGTYWTMFYIELSFFKYALMIRSSVTAKEFEFEDVCLWKLCSPKNGRKYFGSPTSSTSYNVL